MSTAHARRMTLPEERRGAPRRWRLQSGRISAGDGEVVECVIMDISESGARVRLEAGHRLPARFYLIDDEEGVAYKARLVRSSGPEHGVELIRKIDLKHPGRLITEVKLGED